MKRKEGEQQNLKIHQVSFLLLRLPLKLNTLHTNNLQEGTAGSKIVRHVHMCTVGSIEIFTSI